jgi:signal peptidase
MLLSSLARGVSTLLTVVFAVLGIALVTLAIFARTDEVGVTRVAGHSVLTVLSDSMTPTFEAGDLIVGDVVGGRADTLTTGTIITFRANKILVTHRIVEVENGPGGEVSYRTQGDANNAVDATPVTPDEVVAVYAWHVPNAGYVLRDLRTPAGLSILIVGLAVLLLAPVFVRWWRAAGEGPDDEEISKEEKKEEEALEPQGVR